MRKIYKVKYPFYWGTTNIFDEIESIINSWIPGTIRESIHDEYPPEDIAHAEGFMILKLIKIVKLPKPYPTRVFYTRSWIDPNGKEFGRTKLRVATLTVFNKLTHGYRYEYKVREYGSR